MSVDPLKKPINRATQLKTETQNHKGVKLYDVDLAIAEHMMDVVVPTLEILNENVKIPVLYGNPERWKSIKKDGYLRDKHGQIQLPVIVFKRNSIAKNDSMASAMNRHLVYPTVTKYSAKHRYDKFSTMTNTRRPIEQYNITMPDYVTITYEVNIWTDFTEHMNKILEAFQYATDEYWGDKSGFKFAVRIDSFENQQEVGDNSQRVVRSTFNMTVNAYLLPEKFDNQSTTKKSFSPKKVVWGLELDLTGNTHINNNSAKNEIVYNEYADLIDFISIRGSYQGTFVNSNTITLDNVRLPECPPELRGSFDDTNWFRVYINGVFIEPAKYTYTYNVTTNDVTFVFNTNSPASDTQLGYILENTDEFYVTGKFIEL
jgi:hypothetical protein